VTAQTGAAGGHAAEQREVGEAQRLKAPDALRIGLVNAGVPAENFQAAVSERAAVLDIVSGGRLEFGTGRSARIRRAASSSLNKVAFSV